VSVDKFLFVLGEGFDNHAFYEFRVENPTAAFFVAQVYCSATESQSEYYKNTNSMHKHGSLMRFFRKKTSRSSGFYAANLENAQQMPGVVSFVKRNKIIKTVL
jgi:hypothetical protein